MLGTFIWDLEEGDGETNEAEAYFNTEEEEEQPDAFVVPTKTDDSARHEPTEEKAIPKGGRRGPSWNSPILSKLLGVFSFSPPAQTSAESNLSVLDDRLLSSTYPPPNGRRLPSAAFTSSTVPVRRRFQKEGDSPPSPVELRDATEDTSFDDTQPDGRCLTRMDGSVVLLAPATDLSWYSFVRLLDRRDKAAHEKLHQVVRHPIPPELRGLYWKIITGAKACILKNNGLFEVLLAKSSPYEYKIQKDIYRTLPEVPFFRQEKGQQSLFRILKAYAVLDHELGYCQSMSYVAAVLLLYLEEQDAFWVLCQLIKTYHMSGFYQKGLPSLRLALFQLEKLIEQQMPKLHYHLKAEGVRTVLYASEWFSTVFVYSLPLPVVVRIWDIFLVEGVEYLFKVSLALLALSHDHLLSLSFEDIVKFLKDRERETTRDVDEIIRVADKTMWCIDKVALDELEEKYNHPPTSIFRVEDGI